MKKKLFILHPGKANYPDIDAYRSYFIDKYDVIDGTRSDYEKVTDKSEVILWCIMGFYSKKIEAKFVIHDYRSLSVGRFIKLKDLAKKIFNVKPDLRIFLNNQVEDVMEFNDTIPSCRLDMGVPKWIFGIQPVSEVKGTFCYIGEMSLERGFDKVIDSFLSNKKDKQTFVLVGNPEKKILEKYEGEKSLVFTGRVPQKTALEIVKSSEYAVCYFPYHRPHCFQTPTKLLEYAALGVNIICNDSPSNLGVLKEYSINATVTRKNIFDDLYLSNTTYLNPDLIKKLEWSQVIDKASVEDYILND
ncbi:MAG: glycosyltransferase involved in cell wall biosynthesis [Cognaticolwellia sp.]